MKRLLHQVWFLLELIWVSPLLLPFLLTTEQEIIQADLERWVEALGWKQQVFLVQLLLLLKRIQEYRNLYYFRLCKGNLGARSLMHLLKIFFPPSPTLFLEQSCHIGAGLFIQHGFSTIIMADIGENCWINQQVTIGYKDKSGRPHIGDNVRITAGAKVLGDIKIGNHVTIGANAVVVKDVPENCVVVGIPARIIKRNGVSVNQAL